MSPGRKEAQAEPSARPPLLALLFPTRNPVCRLPPRRIRAGRATG